MILPGALPSVLVGLRFSLGIMWLTLIVAETIGLLRHRLHFLSILLGPRIVWDDGVVERVHAHGNRTGTLHIRLLQENDRRIGVPPLGFQRRHRTGDAPLVATTSNATSDKPPTI